MEKKKEKSGALKRRLQKEKVERQNKLPKLDKFFVAANQRNNEAQFKDTLDVNNVDQGSMANKEQVADCTGLEIENCQLLVENAADEKLPTESAYYYFEKFQNKELDTVEKKIIVDMGPVQPLGPFPKDPLQQGRCFSKSYYMLSTKYGAVRRFWLCYSKAMDAVYCQPCWLFAPEKSSMCTGYRSWKYLSDKIKQHSLNNAHTQACTVYETWKKRNTVDKDLENQILKESSFWKMVLQRLFDISITLAKGSLAFRGHREDLSKDHNPGNFLSIVQLVAKYDHVLRQVLDMPKGATKYLSAQIQNEIIQCIGSELEHQLLEKIRSTQFFTVILDTTQDIAKEDQLSLVVRFAAIKRTENGCPSNIEISEVFLGFFKVSDHSAADLVDFVTKIFLEKNLDLKNCVGQGYDGANVMSGVYNGVQKKIKDIQPNAKYVHCASHNLNLVVNDAVQGCVQAQCFFAILEDLFCFFGNSIVSDGNPAQRDMTVEVVVWQTANRADRVKTGVKQKVEKNNVKT